MKNLLCINTVGHGTQIALVCGGKKDFLDAPFAKHSETLFDCLEKVLGNNIKLNELDALGVVVGPGSFTGIRIGLSVINTFSFVNKTPIVCVNAFEVLAFSAKHLIKNNQQICAAMNAGSGQVYFQVFKFNEDKLEKVCEPSVETVSHFESFIKNMKDVFVCSDEELDVKVKLKVVDFSPEALLNAVLMHLNNNSFTNGNAQPLYLRLSQGEVCKVKLDKVDFVPAGVTEKMALLSVDLQNKNTAWDELTWQNKLKTSAFVCKQALFSGTLVGAVAYNITNNIIEIEKLFVSSAAKGQGVAKFMLNQVLMEAEKQNIKTIVASVDAKNLPAVNLFMQFGFVKEKEENSMLLIKKQLL